MHSIRKSLRPEHRYAMGKEPCCAGMYILCLLRISRVHVGSSVEQIRVPWGNWDNEPVGPMRVAGKPECQGAKVGARNDCSRGMWALDYIARSSNSKLGTHTIMNYHVCGLRHVIERESRFLRIYSWCSVNTFERLFGNNVVQIWETCGSRNLKKVGRIGRPVKSHVKGWGRSLDKEICVCVYH